MEMVFSHNYCCGPCLFFFRRLYICSVLRNNHYKTLGLPPSATQAEIKSAYYELSKKHHPDRNQGSQTSAKIFKDITAAYEILGNEKLRKKYDITHSFSHIVNKSNNFDTSSSGYNDDIERMYYERRQRRFDRRYYYGKTSYYDFDAWYRGHYGKNSFYEFEALYKNHFQRNHKFTFKNYKQFNETLKRRDSFLNKTENAFLLILFAIIVGTMVLRI